METWMPSRVRCLHDDNGNLFVLGRLFSCSSPSRAASRRLATVKTSASLAQDGRFVRNNLESKRKELKDYFEESKEMIKADGGPPRWFSPLGSGSHSHDSPLLLYLPGIDGTGLALIRQHQMLGKLVEDITSPVILSTLDNGKIVRGLGGIPSEGSVLIVGYHMLFGMELIPIISQFFIQQKMILRGMVHPLLFERLRSKGLLDLLLFDVIRLAGAVLVSAKNFYKLLSSKSDILLYPGGAREVFHQKDELYKLPWPNQSEFVRMAARFGAKIVPFGTVGAHDVFEDAGTKRQEKSSGTIFASAG